MSGAFSRSKGKRGELWLRDQLRRIWPAAKRGWQARSGKDAPDVEGVPHWWEMKSGKRPNGKAALLQATEATDGRVPIAVCKPDRERAYAVMWLDDLLALMASGAACDGGDESEEDNGS